MHFLEDSKKSTSSTPDDSSTFWLEFSENLHQRNTGTE